MRRALGDRIAAAPLLMSILASLGAAACAPLATREARPAHSSLGCMEAALHGLEYEGLSDSEAHCLAAGLIARRCSVAESILAGIGKEMRDAFGPGDAEWRDLSANRGGIRCARSTSDQQQLRACCQSR